MGTQTPKIDSRCMQGLSGSEKDQDGSPRDGERNLKLSNLLWMFSRKVRHAEVIGSGDPKKVACRAKNRAAGKALGKMARRLWP